MGEHISVLLRESIDLLDVRDGGTYLDLTLGRGGHSSEILKRIPHGRLIAFDVDGEAVAESKKRLDAIGSNYVIYRENFADVGEVLLREGIPAVDGILMDLGVSSPQFDEAERGFSYKEEAPLDMRMDRRNPLTAYKVVNGYDLRQLTTIFREYGEESESHQIAKAIVRRRSEKPIETTTELSEIVLGAKSRRARSKKGFPAKQVFQAIRIEVNDELGNLRRALDAIPRLVAPNGVIAVISFHSLEDRLVKSKFRSLTVVEGSRHGPDALPIAAEEAPFANLTKKPIVADATELTENHRAASAKLRAVRRRKE
ncbi:MAG: 16S rRNA (cytosine(1402)-N(4))-methyltransferase RsmH [Bacilli bacterium]|jgi:16S rRNA (cytosine1402-N4)-methyltransferase|nr:16S rRNA (cytosine(1402)-N(4))-methyltransferase RsmH [Bacilli bacterium]